MKWLLVCCLLSPLAEARIDAESANDVARELQIMRFSSFPKVEDKEDPVPSPSNETSQRMTSEEPVPPSKNVTGKYP